MKVSDHVATKCWF